MAHLSRAAAQGERAEQQDRSVIADIAGPPAGTLLAVMDGHGGPRTAEIAATHLAAIVQLSLQSSPSDLPQALSDTVQRLAQRTAIEASGSTLSVVFVPRTAETACVAVLGDSPVLVRTRDETVWVSPLHHVRSNLAERQAALRRGGVYVHGYLEDPDVPDEGLQMSRALGDRKLSRVLSREADTFTLDLGPGSWILVATDGVLDGSNLDFSGQLQRLAREVEKGFDAQALVEDALRRRTGDNVSLLLWKY
jgi:serine/threonine protein phosphatase PrpC